jgi:phospholipase C
MADPIKHVVVMMFENRSFDHALGGLEGVIAGLDGSDPTDHGRINKDLAGNSYSQQPNAPFQLPDKIDPKHDTNNVLNQLRNNNTGFVADLSHEHPEYNAAQLQQVMNYFPDGALPALHHLAKKFVVCNRWFSSVPGPTWANRFFVHSGTAQGRVKMPSGIFDMPLHWYSQTTIYDRLNQAGKSWRIYHGDIPQSLALVHMRELHNLQNYHKLSTFFADATGPEANFPNYAFIEPEYFWPHPTDDHPPHSSLSAQRLLANVYNALIANKELWQSTLLVVLYDEHGGFYDHISPPKAVPPDEHTEEYTFDRYGVRVPAVLASPWLKPGVDNTEYDHTSLLKYLTDKWSLGPLTARVAAANSFGSQISSVLRTDSFAPIAVNPPAGSLASPPPARAEMNDHHAALVGMSQMLESLGDHSAEDVKARMQRSLTGYDGAVDAASDRVEMFINDGKRAA